MPRGSRPACAALSWNAWGSEFICEWRARHTPPIMSVTWTIPSYHGPSTPHYSHLVALRHELESWLSFYFEPRERMRAPNPVKEVHQIGLRGEELAAFLNTLRALDARQFGAVEEALHMVIPSITGIHVEVNSLGEVELRLREGG